MFRMSLEDAEALAQEIAQRQAGEEHRRPDVLRREDAIVVLWQELQRVRVDPCSRPPPKPGSGEPTH